MNTEKLINVCEEISKDMENDAKSFDGLPFSGKTVGTMNGNICAAIRTLSEIIKIILKEHDNPSQRTDNRESSI